MNRLTCNKAIDYIYFYNLVQGLLGPVCVLRVLLQLPHSILCMVSCCKICLSIGIILLVTPFEVPNDLIRGPFGFRLEFPK